jgi:hypothetical protein
MQGAEKWHLEFETGLEFRGFAALFLYLKTKNLQVAVSLVGSLV